MLKKRAPLEDDDFIDLLERELEFGVQFDRTPEFDENSHQTLLAGLIGADEHVVVHGIRKD